MGLARLTGMATMLCIANLSFNGLACAQVLANGPNGYGYVSTPNPISPPCPAPKLWLMTNGVYSCRLPPSGGGGTGGGTPATVAQQQAVCLAAMNTLGGGLFTADWMQGPVRGEGLDSYTAATASYFAYINSGSANLDADRWVGPQPTSGQNDMWSGFSGGYAYCWLTPGTTNIIALNYLHASTTNGGVN